MRLDVVQHTFFSAQRDDIQRSRRKNEAGEAYQLVSFMSLCDMLDPHDTHTPCW